MGPVANYKRHKNVGHTFDSEYGRIFRSSDAGGAFLEVALSEQAALA